ncbi:Disco-interacting protein 2 B [Xenoophorus captivus]|uniref:Disco-interacting protein 2 B n=1 Tax=Xenoophorus captivus TaxID=1517983 RepID=A0ABV0REQ9_9TELE
MLMEFLLERFHLCGQDSWGLLAQQPTLPDKFDLVVWLPLQAIDSIHQVGLYCLALVPANTLPKTPLGGIHISDTKQFFLDGNLHPCNILMCPHTCVTNLPKPRQKQPGESDIRSTRS